MFHAKDRFYFHRNPDGSVLVRAVVNEKVTHETTLDDHAWASVVSAVCARNESGPTYREALAFHNQEPADG
jgi:hypothetical protein